MDSVIDYYTGFAEREWARLDREPLEYIINYRYIKQYFLKKHIFLIREQAMASIKWRLLQRGIRSRCINGGWCSPERKHLNPMERKRKPGI
ncbi:hypothetical protein LIT25_16755 [Bacillus sp. F19]|nr:hypothetical protein LIT25_16755 [Bacillus sp. F19]